MLGSSRKDFVAVGQLRTFPTIHGGSEMDADRRVRRKQGHSSGLPFAAAASWILAIER